MAKDDSLEKVSKSHQPESSSAPSTRPISGR